MESVVRLRTLIEVARRGSFSAAADALAFTQPSVSRQIATLEAEVGAQLLARDARSVRLTQAGEVLVEHAEAVLARLDAAKAQLDELSGLEAGRLAISAFGSANVRLVPQALMRFADRHPKVELSLVRGDLAGPHRSASGIEAAPVLAAVRSGDVDLALITSWDLDDGGAEGVELVWLLDDELYLALPRAHPLAARKRLAFPELAEETWIEGAHPDCLGPLQELGRLIGAEPRIGFHCDDWTGKQALVGAGVGIMLVPSLAAENLRDDIVVRRMPRSFPPREIYAAVPSGYRAPAVDEMLACLRAVAESGAT
jgi:DNA-binding transcriptional LysR family regulator